MIKAWWRSAVMGDEVEEAPPIPNEKTMTMLIDIIEYEVEMIFLDKSNRCRHWQTLNFFWDLFPGRRHRYGRLYLRKLMAQLLVEYCSQPPYGIVAEPDGDAPSVADGTAAKPMVQWDRSRWSQLLSDLQDLRECLSRKDATELFIDEDVEKEEIRPEEDSARSGEFLFQKKFHFVQKLLLVNQAIVPARLILENGELAGASTTTKPNIVSKSTVREMLNFVNQSQFEGCKKHVKRLFVSGGLGEQKVRDEQEIASMIMEKPFDLDYVQEKLDVLVQKFSICVFGDRDPNLLQLRYRIPSRLVALVRTLPNQPTWQRRTSPRREKSAQALDMGDDNYYASICDTDEDEDDTPLAALGEQGHTSNGTGERGVSDRGGAQDNDSGRPHKRPRGMGPSNSDDDDWLPKESSSPRKKVQKRRRWTPEEKNAVKEGVKMYGVGNWASIKKEYKDILQNRTGVQIKDVWRTMLNTGEVLCE